MKTNFIYNSIPDILSPVCLIWGICVLEMRWRLITGEKDIVNKKKLGGMSKLKKAFERNL